MRSFIRNRTNCFYVVPIFNKVLTLFVIVGNFLLLYDLWSAEIVGKVSTPRLKSPKDVIVYIEKVEGKKFPPSAPQRMDQTNIVFVPRVLPILLGTTVQFYNSDKVRHNIFGIGAVDFDLGTWGHGVVKPYVFNKLGVINVLCNVHHEMEAFIIVLQNPYFALANENGEYKIKDVPEGVYTLKTWHNKLKPQTQNVEIKKDTTSLVTNFTIIK